LPQRIAIISVESSKGYLDFLRILDDNKWKYSFFHMLFPSLLQGDKAIEAIIRQLHRIRKVMSHFDVVAIIRGGGGEVGLTCYNDYRLAEQIATFPLPVITGIGHSTNQTVVEMIAGINAITPTDMADILIQKFHNFSVPVDRARTKILTLPMQKLEDWKGNFLFQRRYFESQSMRRIDAHKNNLKRVSQSLTQESLTNLRKSDHELIQFRQMLTKDMSYRLNTEKIGLAQQQIDLKKNVNRSFEIAVEQVNTLEKQIRLLHPDSVMKRGYSVTRIRGKLITSAGQVNIGDEIETQLVDGILTGIIQDKKTNKPS
jgi:exodeoxyribonuclease VII large subunit